MANKVQGKNWGDIQLAIASVAITAMLGLWNLFSAPGKTQASSQVEQTFTPLPPPPTETAQPNATALSLRPVKIIFGGQGPQQPVVQGASAAVAQSPVIAQPPAKRRGGGGGGPAPAASTGSSRP